MSPIDLICHDCGTTLAWPERDCSSTKCICGRVYDCLLGIPDFRTHQDPYCGNERDKSIADDLVTVFPHATFQELLDRFFSIHCPELRPKDVERQKRHIFATNSSLPIARLSSGTTGSEGPILDLGCGSGGALLSFCSKFPATDLVGIDIALRWLVIARKWLDESGLNEVRLVCCQGERLPFRNESFSAVYGGDVIEHVEDAVKVFRETGRVLSSEGIAIFVTPNRRSLGREPHVGLFFAGWLPHRWAERYCRLMKAPPWRDIFTRSATEWSNEVGNVLCEFPNIRIDISPATVTAGRVDSAWILRVYDRILRDSHTFRSIARAFGPILEIRMEK